MDVCTKCCWFYSLAWHFAKLFFFFLVYKCELIFKVGWLNHIVICLFCKLFFGCVANLFHCTSPKQQSNTDLNFVPGICTVKIDPNYKFIILLKIYQWVNLSVNKMLYILCNRVYLTNEKQQYWTLVHDMVPSVEFVLKYKQTKNLFHIRAQCWH